VARAEEMRELLAVDAAGWRRELEDIKANHYPRFGAKLPKELARMLEEMETRLK